MINTISTPLGNVSSFTLMICVGILGFIAVLIRLLKNSDKPLAERDFILPKIVLSGLVGFLSAGLFDATAKIPYNNSFKPAGISFYGGLIGSIIAMFFCIYCNKNKTQYSVCEWFNILSQPMIVFHIFGRIGCFLGGCCYGKVTTGPLGVYFPDVPSHNIFHNAQKCYPTQIFEVFVLIFILLILQKCKSKFLVYILLYSIGRFFIEYFRGDSRGQYFLGLSPAQIISIVLFVLVITIFFIKHKVCSIRKKHRIGHFA